MKSNKSSLWLRLFGWALLIHVVLIALSFIEVFLYSVLINPGQEESFYNDHAAQSAPYVSIIFGIILFYIIARRLAKKSPQDKMLIALALPIFYIVLDLLMLIPFDVDWGSHYLVFILSFGSKLVAAYAGTKI